jgi:PIN domain nuclease of toxin-antitoxin system
MGCRGHQSDACRRGSADFEVAIRSREIMGSHADPADRFLVATALVYDLTLVTADDALIDSKLCPVLKNS